MGKWIHDPKNRKYVYSIAVAVLPLLVIAGIITENVAPLIVTVLGTVFVPALAAVNTDTNSAQQP